MNLGTNYKPSRRGLTRWDEWRDNRLLFPKRETTNHPSNRPSSERQLFGGSRKNSKSNRPEIRPADLRGNQTLKTCTPESRGGDKDGIGNLKTAHAAARFAAAVPRSIFHQGQDSGRLNRRAPRGLQRVGFLAKWPKSGVLGRFVDANKMMPGCDTARKVRAPLLRKKREKVNKRQTDRDREIENSTRRPTLRAWPSVQAWRTSGRSAVTPEAGA